MIMKTHAYHDFWDAGKAGLRRECITYMIIPNTYIRIETRSIINTLNDPFDEVFSFYFAESLLHFTVQSSKYLKAP